MEWHAFLSDWDVLLSPTWAQPAFAHGTTSPRPSVRWACRRPLRPVLPANLLGLPAAVVPCGVVDGLPISAQLIARRFNDLTALAAAQAVEDAIGSLTPIEPSAGDAPARRPRPPRRHRLRRRPARDLGPGRRGVPVDQRLPSEAKASLRVAMGAGGAVEPGDALVVATSGSTGAPRGVVLTHDAVAVSARATSQRLG